MSIKTIEGKTEAACHNLTEHAECCVQSLLLSDILVV
jgi:hypothetical protein